MKTRVFLFSLAAFFAFGAGLVVAQDGSELTSEQADLAQSRPELTADQAQTAAGQANGASSATAAIGQQMMWQNGELVPAPPQPTPVTNSFPGKEKIDVTCPDFLYQL